MILKSDPRHRLRAILYAVAGFTTWVFADSLMKIAGSLAIPKYTILMLSSLSGMAVVATSALFSGGLSQLKIKRSPLTLIVLGLIFSATYGCYVTAASQMPLTNFYAITFLAPLLITLLAGYFLHERVGWKHCLAIFLGFVGVIIATDPSHLIHDEARGVVYIIALGGMLGNAFQMLILRVISSYESRESVIFYSRLVSFLVTLVFAGIFGLNLAPHVDLLLPLASGMLGGVGWLFITHAYKHAPAATVAPFHYSQIVAATLLGYLVWGDIPSWNLIIGIAIIVGSGLYIALHTPKTAVIEETPNE